MLFIYGEVPTVSTVLLSKRGGGGGGGGGGCGVGGGVVWCALCSALYTTIQWCGVHCKKKITNF